MHSETVKF